MGSMFVTRTSDPDPEEIEGSEPLARIAFGGLYFFLYPAILRLRDQTGHLIDPQHNAFFAGPDLDQLQSFVVASQTLAAAQPDTWNQRVGTKGPKAEVIHEATTRHDIVQFLAALTGAIQTARERRMGVLFWGE
jgi:hypothetical protein